MATASNSAMGSSLKPTLSSLFHNHHQEPWPSHKGQPWQSGGTVHRSHSCLLGGPGVPILVAIHSNLLVSGYTSLQRYYLRTSCTGRALGQIVPPLGRLWVCPSLTAVSLGLWVLATLVHHQTLRTEIQLVIPFSDTSGTNRTCFLTPLSLPKSDSSQLGPHFICPSSESAEPSHPSSSFE
jgi:hypothetical protein